MRMAARTTRERSPWALLSVLLVVTLFGLFWLWQQRALRRETPAPAIYQAATQSMLREDPLDLSVLEASAVNISIPKFETLF